MVAFPLAPFLMRAGITALGAGAAGEGIKSLQNINPDVAEQAFLRTIIGPISDIFNRTTDTPSGKVFAPTGEVIEPNQIPGIAPPEQQQGITGLPIPEQQQGITWNGYSNSFNTEQGVFFTYYRRHEYTIQGRRR
jgi:hypothetical protein